MSLQAFLPPLVGGALIGVAASVLLVANGRIAGISGVVGELLVPGTKDTGWRWSFLAGMLGATAIVVAFLPTAIAAHPSRSLPAVIAAGLIVGFGTRMGNGCTSGHGVCGIPRGSARSITATLVFMFTGAVTVAIIRAFGGAL